MKRFCQLCRHILLIGFSYLQGIPPTHKPFHESWFTWVPAPTDSIYNISRVVQPYPVLAPPPSEKFGTQTGWHATQRWLPIQIRSVWYVLHFLGLKIQSPTRIPWQTQLDKWFRCVPSTGPSPVRWSSAKSHPG